MAFRRLSLRGFPIFGPATNPSIGQALANDTGDAALHAFGIVDAQAFAVAVAIVKLNKVTLQMLRADVVERADDTALEDREEVFDRVGVMEERADVLLLRMVDRGVTSEILGDGRIDGAVVRDDPRRLVDLLLQDRLQGSAIHVADMVGTDAATTLH